MNHFIKLIAAAAFATSLLSTADAQTKDTAPAADSSAAMEMSHGEIKSIDKESGKVTIKHGELKNLSMPAMTMVFRVQDAALLNQVKAGDKIDFMAEKVNGALTVTMLEVAH